MGVEAQTVRRKTQGYDPHVARVLRRKAEKQQAKLHKNKINEINQKNRGPKFKPAKDKTIEAKLNSGKNHGTYVTTPLFFGNDSLFEPVYFVTGDKTTFNGTAYNARKIAGFTSIPHSPGNKTICYTTDDSNMAKPENYVSESFFTADISDLTATPQELRLLRKPKFERHLQYDIPVTVFHNRRQDISAHNYTVQDENEHATLDDIEKYSKHAGIIDKLICGLSDTRQFDEKYSVTENMPQHTYMRILHAVLTHIEKSQKQAYQDKKVA